MKIVYCGNCCDVMTPRSEVRACHCGKTKCRKVQTGGYGTPLTVEHSESGRVLDIDPFTGTQFETRYSRDQTKSRIANL